MTAHDPALVEKAAEALCEARIEDFPCSGVCVTDARAVLDAVADDLREQGRAEVHDRIGAGARRCQFISPTPWGPSQCALPDGHERHAFSPSEAGEQP